MSNAPIETRDIAEADLDGVAGGLSVAGMNALDLSATQTPGNLSVMASSVDALSVDVAGAPLDTSAITG